MDLADRITALQRKKATASADNSNKTRGIMPLQAPARRAEGTTDRAAPNALFATSTTGAISASNLPYTSNLLPTSLDQTSFSPPSPSRLYSSESRRPTSPQRVYSDTRHPSSPRRSNPAGGRLFDPENDPIPMLRRAHEPAQMHASPTSSHQAPRQLFDPTQPSQTYASQSQASVPQQRLFDPLAPPHQPPQRLFDPRRDDPMRFAVLNSTTHSARQGTGNSSSIPSSSIQDHSSISSYTSSTWTLNSSANTSASSAPEQGQADRNAEKEGSSKFIAMLKKVYREILELEKKTKEWDALLANPFSEDSIPSGGQPQQISLLKHDSTITPASNPTDQSEDNEEGEPFPDENRNDPLRRLVSQHKQLAELYHSMITMILQPVPASMLSFVTKYQLPQRLWTNAIMHCVDLLRRLHSASRQNLTSTSRTAINMNSTSEGKWAGAIEHMTSYLIWSYRFYESLYETSTMNEFMAPYRVNWVEALGDLARYQMHIAARHGNHDAMNTSSVNQHLSNGQLGSSQATLQVPLVDGLFPHSSLHLPASQAPQQTSRRDESRMDDGDRDEKTAPPPPSVGLAAAAAFHLEPEQEIWRRSSQTWYSLVLKETPGVGKLMHNLGLLASESKGENGGEELRGVYHFVKSMTSAHPYPTAREAILSLFSPTLQARRSLPSSTAPELFLLLHGMLFTNIQLDDFQPTLSRYLERLALDGAQEREWIMMGVVNIASVLQYGKPDAIIKAAASSTAEATGAAKKRELVLQMNSLAMTDSPTAERMDVDVPTESTMELDIPLQLHLALQLTFRTLSFCLLHPLRRSSPFARPTLNPYIPLLLTFVTTILKQSHLLPFIERIFPWDDLIAFLRTGSRRQLAKEVEARAKLTSGCAPLPEDWCLRGMGWVGRRVYEHGFWPRGQSSNSITGELDVLLADEKETVVEDGIIEDDDAEGGEKKDYTGRRWVRILRSALGMVGTVPGFEVVQDAEGTRFELGEAMRTKAQLWAEEERREREEEERRRNRVWDDDETMEVDEEEEEEELDDDPTVRALQERRRYLRALQTGRGQRRPSAVRGPRAPNRPSNNTAKRPTVNALPGYTVLVVDTNILLSALSMITTFVESEKWTVLIPLAVITELDGISNQPSELGRAAQAALEYIITHIRTHSSSLKVQTSRGNYLTTLNVRSENFDMSRDRMERSLDDLILRAAVWQEEHWVDRSLLLRGVPSTRGQPTGETAKVVLLSFDRNLRLKARARQLHAGDERDLAHILTVGSS